MRPWYTLPDMQPLLADLAANPPLAVRHEQRYPMTTDEWLSYDMEDVRVAALKERCDAYLTDALEMSDRCVDRELAREIMISAGIMVTADAAIDAVRTDSRRATHIWQDLPVIEVVA